MNNNWFIVGIVFSVLVTILSAIANIAQIRDSLVSSSLRKTIKKGSQEADDNFLNDQFKTDNKTVNKGKQARIILMVLIGSIFFDGIFAYLLVTHFTSTLPTKILGTATSITIHSTLTPYPSTVTVGPGTPTPTQYPSSATVITTYSVPHPGTATLAPRPSPTPIPIQPTATNTIDKCFANNNKNDGEYYITVPINNYQDLLTNVSSEVTFVTTGIQSRLSDCSSHQALVVYIYAGMPSGGNANTSLDVANKVVNIAQSLGRNGFIFISPSYDTYSDVDIGTYNEFTMEINWRN